MVSPVCFITFVISYVSLGVWVGFCFNSGCRFGYASHGITTRDGSRSSAPYWETRETESLLLWNLVYLDLSLSGSSGSIPPQIGGLSSLEYLDLSCLRLLKVGPEALADNEACVSRVSQKRVVADCLQVIFVLQLKNQDLYREGEGKIQSQNTVQDAKSMPVLQLNSHV
ncbi:hypothetical protein V6N11_053886 [Hibiscus sabdariffa]|uniref:Uncharacterized protein n=1 Tax=Hibiscus sabdariffa TaxID=183260 RepID=A0ABR2S285_9ROSI